MTSDRVERLMEGARAISQICYVKIAEDGALELTDLGPEWVASFARDHRVGFSSGGGPVVSTVFLGVARRPDDGTLKGAFETIVWLNGILLREARWDSLEEARREHARLIGEEPMVRDAC